jgi:hypothetical protein
MLNMKMPLYETDETLVMQLAERVNDAQRMAKQVCVCVDFVLIIV